MPGRNAFLAVFTLLAAAACTTIAIDLPAVTETASGERLPGKVVWRDLLTNDPAASQRFYGELFGWTFESVGLASGLEQDTSYTLIRHNGKLIGGMIDTVALNGRDDVSQWIVLMSVANIDVAVTEAKKQGGTVITPPTDLQKRGTVAVLRDGQGALLGFLQTRDGDPPDAEPTVGGFLWDELWTTDVAGADEFYGAVAGLESSVYTDEGAEAGYRLLKAGETARAGMMDNPLEGLDPVWVSYIRVADPAATAARANDLGGRILVEAQPRPLGGTVAFIAGPSGAGIAVQTWPPENSNDEETM
ncbi:MAG: VOC family protein [Pseudomonadota bacterium]